MFVCGMATKQIQIGHNDHEERKTRLEINMKRRMVARPVNTEQVSVS